mmetsp:Transcript_26317/g.51729  ORF Transcript_26317/g.51729 Transcript_26317/m.51729 type:complete len:234 (+) Transcript_26317:232-933(+)
MHLQTKRHRHRRLHASLSLCLCRARDSRAPRTQAGRPRTRTHFLSLSLSRHPLRPLSLSLHHGSREHLGDAFRLLSLSLLQPFIALSVDFCCLELLCLERLVVLGLLSVDLSHLLLVLSLQVGGSLGVSVTNAPVDLLQKLTLSEIVSLLIGVHLSSSVDPEDEGESDEPCEGLGILASEKRGIVRPRDANILSIGVSGVNCCEKGSEGPGGHYSRVHGDSRCDLISSEVGRS